MLESQGLPNAVLYIIISFVCLFVVFWGLFVGVYFYRHCVKTSSIAKDTGECQPNLIEGYKSLDRFESNRAMENVQDPTYLEPIFDARSDYVEIENHNEEVMQPSDCPLISQCSVSFPFPIYDDVNDNNDDSISCTHSL